MKAPERTLVIAGAGRVATAVAVLLQRGGFEVVAVASRTEDTARRASERLGAPYTSLDELPASGIVLIGAPDSGIPEIAARIARGLRPDSVLWHLSGALGTSALAAAPRALPAALHPVQACPDVDAAVANLPGSVWGVTCHDRLRRWAHEVVTGPLEGRAVDVAEGDRPLWHAAAVTTANGIAAMLAAGEAMLAAIDIVDPSAVLAPLAQGAVRNARAGGGGAATLTGPVVRGEYDAIARHLDHLRADAPGLLASYVGVARMVVEGARRAGRIDGAVEKTMTKLLDDAQ
ncbi:MAG TPA: DUF2520 domain-containing protein [Actinomycetota bacterium]|nr:DUF2520 domain-containing protein [Actinomycetota bacterium]